MYQSVDHHNQLARRQPAHTRRAVGAITPFIAMAVILMMGMMGVCIDLTRDFETARQLKFAAQSAAIYGLSLATNTDGTYTAAAAMNNIQNGIFQAGNSSWNVAEFGPATNAVTNNPKPGIASEPVTFATGDVQFVNNPLDNSEFFLQLTARRQGQDALQQFFLPLLYTSFNGPAPQSVRTVSTHRVVEVLGQPATRIGAGAPLNSAPGTRDAQLAGFATLPLAISYNQFAPLTNPALTNTQYTIDLVTSKSTGAVAAGHIKGCLVNVFSTANGATVYGGATGTTAVNQLLGLLGYFGAQTGQPAIAPAVVEMGSGLFAFDPAQWSTVQKKAIAQALAPNNFRPGLYIIPVLANDPNFGAIGATGPNQVVGFAHLNLTSFTIVNGVPTQATVLISDPVSGSYSVPVRNATAAIMASIPTGSLTLMGSFLPGNTGLVSDPFLPRTYDPVANTVSIRPRGIVLAPALSPRQIPTF